MTRLTLACVLVSFVGTFNPTVSNASVFAGTPSSLEALSFQMNPGDQVEIEVDPLTVDPQAQFLAASLTSPSGDLLWFFYNAEFEYESVTVQAHAAGTGLSQDVPVVQYAHLGVREVYPIAGQPVAPGSIFRLAFARWGPDWNAAVRLNGAVIPFSAVDPSRAVSIRAEDASVVDASVSDAQAAALFKSTRHEDGYLFALLIPGRAGSIEIAGPNGYDSQTNGLEPGDFVAEPTKGDWTFSVTAAVADAHAPWLWIIDLPTD